MCFIYDAFCSLRLVDLHFAAVAPLAPLFGLRLSEPFLSSIGPGNGSGTVPFAGFHLSEPPWLTT